MKFLGVFDGIFWGVVLIALGAWFLVRDRVPVHLPVVRIVVAALFIWLGVRVLVQGPLVAAPRGTAVFTEATLAWDPAHGKDYNLVFASGTVDFREAAAGDTGARAEVNVVFGSGVLRVDPAQPIRVRMSSAFGTVEAPGQRSVAFGDAEWRSPAWRDGAPAVEVRASAVFGRLAIDTSP